MNNPCSEIQLIGNVTVLLQPSKFNPFSTKYFKGQLLFNFFLFYFLRTPLHGLAVCGSTYSIGLLFSYLNHAYLDFSKTGDIFYLIHTLQMATAIFRLILLFNITPEHTLHSIVKNSIPQIIQLSFCLSNLKEDLYVNVNFASTF